MRARTAILPGVARLARLPAEPSAEAKRRLLVVNWYEEHGHNARLTARHFGREFGAIDCFTRKRVVDLALSLTSKERFLHKVISGFPFPIQAIQSDGGSEFLGDFTKTVAELQLTHYFNRPYYPQGNGRIERSFRTDNDEFYHVHDLSADFGGLKDALLAWNHRYESWRLHQALGYLTPDQFYHHWLLTQP